MQVGVFDFVLEDVDLTCGKQLLAAFVASLGDQQLQSEGPRVVGLGVFLGAFALGHGQRADPHLENASVGQFDFFFRRLQVGGLAEAVDCPNGDGGRHNTVLLFFYCSGLNKKKPRWLGGACHDSPGTRLSGLGEVEGRGASWAEVDGHRLGVVGVDVQAGRGQHSVERDRAAEGVAQVTAGEDAVGVQLEGCAVLLALQDVLDHAVGQGGILVGHVDRRGAAAIAEAADVGAERHVLTRGLADRGDVDLGAADLKTPVADLADDGKVGVLDLELVREDSNAVVGDVNSSAADSGGNFQYASASGVGVDVVGRASDQAAGDCAGAGAAGLAVDDAELDGVVDFEVQEGLNDDFVATGSNVGFTERAGGASGLVVKGAGRAGQNGGGHRGVPDGYAVGRDTARLLQE